MAGRLSRRAPARQAMHIQTQIDCAVRNLDFALTEELDRALVRAQ